MLYKFSPWERMLDVKGGGEEVGGGIEGQRTMRRSSPGISKKKKSSEKIRQVRNILKISGII